MNRPADGFNCDHCGKWVPIDEFIGTKNRNHCPYCLWSKHVDDKVAGDRESNCHGGMQPVGLTFKQSGTDKYGRDRQGELMLIHLCSKCGKVSINRIAADDSSDYILDLLTDVKISKIQRDKIESSNIVILGSEMADIVRSQLFGRSKNQD